MKYDEAGLRAVLTDGRYQDIGNLPSNFFPYEYKKLYVRPFTVKELRLISKAAMLKDYSHLIRAVDLVMTEDAYSLTIGDFYYILMWLRIHSMPKTPYIIEWHCHSPVLIHKETKALIFNDETFEEPAEEDEDAYDVEVCKTHNSEIIHMTDVDILCIEDDFEGINEEGSTLFDFPRVAILGELEEAKANPELQLIIGAAQWISSTNEIMKNGQPVKCETLVDKIAFLEEQQDCQIFDDAAAINELVIHGIVETTKLTCRRCRKNVPHTLKIDALSFFR
jgi:hypothetical protein